MGQQEKMKLLIEILKLQKEIFIQMRKIIEIKGEFLDNWLKNEKL